MFTELSLVKIYIHFCRKTNNLEQDEWLCKGETLVINLIFIHFSTQKSAETMQILLVAVRIGILEKVLAIFYMIAVGLPYNSLSPSKYTLIATE